MNRPKRLLTTVLVLALGLGVWTLAVTFTPANFEDGEVVSASDLNDVINSNFDAAKEAIEATQEDLAALETAKQARVAEACPEGSSIRVINEDGTVACETDDVGEGGSGYTAGTGLSLDGTEFSVAPAYRLPQDCADNQVIKTLLNGADTLWHCADDDGLTLPFEGNASVPGDSAAFAVEQTNPGGGSAIEVSSGNFGIDIRSASNVGLNVRRVGGSGVVVNSAGEQGTYGGNGVMVRSATGNGLHVESVDQHGVRIEDAGSIGILVNETVFQGVRVGQAGSQGFLVEKAGNPSETSLPSGNHGFQVGGAEGYGLSIGHADLDGVNIRGAGEDGVDAASNSADHYGGRFINNAAGAGLYARSGHGTAAPDLVLGHNFGVISTDLSVAGSSFALRSNADATLFLDRENSGDATFAVRNGGNFTMLSVDEAGNTVIGGALTENSDRGAKQDIQPVDTQVMLETLARVPISRWAYKDAPDVQHVGPMAQDFYAAFGVGENDTSISTIDRDGVALAAIQGLYQLVQEQQAEILALKEQVRTLNNAADRVD